jgi:hypothetical protein
MKRPLQDSDDEGLSDESHSRADEQARLIVKQQRQQQAEMARRMRVRPLLHLQALGE